MVEPPYRNGQQAHHAAGEVLVGGELLSELDEHHHHEAEVEDEVDGQEGDHLADGGE